MVKSLPWTTLVSTALGLLVVSCSLDTCRHLLPTLVSNRLNAVAAFGFYAFFCLGGGFSIFPRILLVLNSKSPYLRFLSVGIIVMGLLAQR